jgi:hypothetical protein
MSAKTTTQSEDLNNPYGYSDIDWAAQLDPAYKEKWFEAIKTAERTPMMVARR